ncbi:MAG: MFS transporter [Burkholderiales bacterium]|nr:MFS transporter [Burkholderiales bacterium]
MTDTPQSRAAPGWPRSVAALLNLAHAVDHMFLLIFAAAVGTIAAEFGFARWEDLMPYSVGAFFLFGIGSLPAGRLGDLWGRRAMMLVFFFGMGASALLASLTSGPWQMAAALTLLGAFAAIYHPVGIPMLVQHAANPGATIGFNGLVGNLGIAVAALVTGFLIKWIGWRAAFALPGLVCLACGVWFALACPPEREAPAKRKGGASVVLSRAALARAFLVMTIAAITASLLFNLTTNGNGRFLTERFRGVIEDPATLGMLLAAVYAVASIAQVVVGRLIDRYALKPLYFWIVIGQIPLLAAAAHADGWLLFVLLTASMAFIFGAIPFTDAMIVRYVDDRIRSRVAGMRLAVSFSISSTAVWLLGPAVKGMGFTAIFLIMAGIAAVTASMVFLLPSETGEGNVVNA